MGLTNRRYNDSETELRNGERIRELWPGRNKKEEKKYIK